MPSTYSNLGIELIASGEQAGTWGTTTNTNLGTLIDQAIAGYQTQAITDGADTTITIPDGATGVARNMFLELTGALTATRNLIVPTNKKLYFVYNNTTGGFAVTVKVTGLTGVSVPNGRKVILVCNGTDIVEAHNAISGNATVGGTLGVTGNATVGGTLGVTGITTVAAGSAALPAIVSTTGTADTGLWFPAADTVAASTGGTERIRINSTGNLGIGLTSYSLPLSVVANSNGQNIQLNGRTGDSVGQMFFRNFGGTNNLASISSDSSGDLYFGAGSQTAPTVPTERMRIDASGNVLVGKASATANGGDVQVSSGITFPATQVSKSNANTLDDYEEGSWTMTLAFGGASVGITYSSNTGSYTKIGNRVCITGQMQLTSNGTSTGSATIGGLPFSAASYSGIPHRANNFAAAINGVPMFFANGSAITLQFLPNGSSSVNDIDSSQFNTNTDIIVGGQYPV